MSEMRKSWNCTKKFCTSQLNELLLLVGIRQKFVPEIRHEFFDKFACNRTSRNVCIDNRNPSRSVVICVIDPHRKRRAREGHDNRKLGFFIRWGQYLVFFYFQFLVFFVVHLIASTTRFSVPLQSSVERQLKK